MNTKPRVMLLGYAGLTAVLKGAAEGTRFIICGYKFYMLGMPFGTGREAIKHVPLKDYEEYDVVNCRTISKTPYLVPVDTAFENMPRYLITSTDMYKIVNTSVEPHGTFVSRVGNDCLCITPDGNAKLLTGAGAVGAVQRGLKFTNFKLVNGNPVVGTIPAVATKGLPKPQRTLNDYAYIRCSEQLELLQVYQNITSHLGDGLRADYQTGFDEKDSQLKTCLEGLKNRTKSSFDLIPTLTAIRGYPVLMPLPEKPVEEEKPKVIVNPMAKSHAPKEVAPKKEFAFTDIDKEPSAFKEEPVSTPNLDEGIISEPVFTSAVDLSKTAQDWLNEQISKLTYGKKSVTISPSSYDDRISPETVMEAYNEYCAEKKHDHANFKHFLETQVYDQMLQNDVFSYEGDYIEDEIRKNLAEEPEELQSIVEAIIEENAGNILEAGGFEGFNIDLDAFLRGSYRINLIFATPQEQNFDMSSIESMFDTANLINNPRAKELMDNALSYLIRQQGYTVEEVIKAYNNPNLSEGASPFVRSVVQEVQENSSYMNGLTALVTACGDDLTNLLHSIANKEKCIQLPKGTMMGLFDDGGGGGSLLAIELEKPAIIPCRMVCNVQIEKAGKENSGYTVDEVYGLVESAWEHEVTLVDK